MDTRTVQRLLQRAGKRAADFHRLQLQELGQPLQALQMNELYGKLVPSAVEGTVKDKRHTEVVKAVKKRRKGHGKKRAKRGFIRLWP